jgi:cytochrome c554/c'-like protein
VPEIAVVAILGLLAGSLAALGLRRVDPRARRASALVGIGAGAAAGALIVAAASHRTPLAPPPARNLPVQEPAADDASSAACRSCHPEQYATWHASYHRTMTQAVSARAVAGDFGDARVAFGDARYRLFARDGSYFGEVSRGEPAHTSTVRLQQLTGSHHMQIYWMASGTGRNLESFPLVWLRTEQRWIPRTAAFVTPPSDQPGPSSVWNYTCIGCHTTHPEPRIAPTGRTDSHVTEFGIACEACHGSGREHADANRSPLRRYLAHFSTEPQPGITNPSRLSHVRSSQVCGQCHAVKTFYSEEQANEWAQRGPAFRPGDDLEVVANVISNATIDRPFTQEIIATFPDFVRGSFWDDGIVRVTGREYNALIESPCYQRGELSCLSCHELHKPSDDRRSLAAWADDQLTAGMDSDRACVQCHERFADARVAGEHSHHAPGSSGSECQNCHMPHTSYGLLKAVRGHEISNPRVLTAGPGSGRPNACNLCHLDRSLGWTAEQLGRWYGLPAPALGPDDRAIAAGVRWALEGDAGVRALVAWSMGWGPARDAAGTGWLVPYLLELMDDPYDAVRLIAARSLRTLPGQADAPIDPLAPPEQRARAAQAIRARWVALPSSTGGRGPATLFDAHGEVDRAELARLLARRDVRPVNLAE